MDEVVDVEEEVMFLASRIRQHNLTRLENHFVM